MIPHFCALVLGAWLLLGGATAALAGFGPLWIGAPTSAGAACNPTARLAALPHHFMIGAYAHYGNGDSSYLAGMPFTWDNAYIYLNGGNFQSSGCTTNSWQQVITTPYGCGSYPALYLQQFQPVAKSVLFTYYNEQAGGEGAGGSINPATWFNNSTSGVQNLVWYFNDYVKLLQIIETYGNGGPVIIHPEPDMNGYLLSFGDTASTVVNGVSSYIGPDGYTPGLPNTLAGLYQTYVALRNHYAPNAILAWHVSIWGEDGFSAQSNNGGGPPYSVATQAGTDWGTFYNSLFAGSTVGGFDLGIEETSDFDSGLWASPSGCNADNTAGGSTRGWWSSTAFAAYQSFLSAFNAKTGLKLLMWQTPSGNTVYLTENNTNWHWQDDRAQYFLQSSNPNLAPFISGGLIGILFAIAQEAPATNCEGAEGNGGGISSLSGTDMFDHAGDGITNGSATAIPSQAQGIYPGNGSATFQTSTVADDDGGFIRTHAAFAQAVAVCP